MPPFSSGVKKACQKQIYSLLSSRPWVAGLALVGLLWCIGSLMHIFQAALLFSFHEHIRQPEGDLPTMEESGCGYDIDNLGERHFPELCGPRPIDVVYTWVNGSDPDFQEKLHYYRPLFLKQHGLDEDLQERSTAPPVACPEGYWPYHGGSHCCEFPLDKTNQTLRFSSDSCFNNSYVVCPGGAQEGRCGYSCPYDMIAYHLGSHCCNFTMDRDGKPLLFESDTCWANQYLTCPGGTDDGRCVPSSVNLTDSDNQTSAQGVSMLRQRFRDNEELRYSLRSLWEYAPWIRHIYIITNGQLPNWLNLDHPRLTMISHDDILPPDALPTFASPSIETGLHKIPGLADRFIYFNDDIMLGSKVWPDDFYTLARGQKIFLAWAVPSGDPLPCAPNCAFSDIKNGYCDPACNVSQCEFDGNDCEPDEQGVVKTRAPTTAAPTSAYSNYYSPSRGDSCNPGCVDNWLGDGVCDRQCKLKACGFDLGDCGIASVIEVLAEVLEDEEGMWVAELTEDIPGFYVNVSVLGHVVSASHDGPPRLRNAIISKGEGILSVLLRPPPPQGFVCPPNTIAYHRGSHCCNHTLDRDGIPLTYDADTCQNNTYVPCPGGAVEGRCLPKGVAAAEPLSINFRLKVEGVAEDFEFNVTVRDIPSTRPPSSPTSPSISSPTPLPTTLLSHIYSSTGNNPPRSHFSSHSSSSWNNTSSSSLLPSSSSSSSLPSSSSSSSPLPSSPLPSSSSSLPSSSSSSSLPSSLPSSSSSSSITNTTPFSSSVLSSQTTLPLSSPPSPLNSSSLLTSDTSTTPLSPPSSSSSSSSLQNISFAPLSPPSSILSQNLASSSSSSSSSSLPPSLSSLDNNSLPLPHKGKKKKHKKHLKHANTTTAPVTTPLLSTNLSSPLSSSSPSTTTLLPSSLLSNSSSLLSSPSPLVDSANLSASILLSHNPPPSLAPLSSSSSSLSSLPSSSSSSFSSLPSSSPPLSSSSTPPPPPPLSSSSSSPPTLVSVLSKVSSRLKKLRMSPLATNPTPSSSFSTSSTGRIVVSRRIRETPPPTPIPTRFVTTNTTTTTTTSNITPTMNKSPSVLYAFPPSVSSRLHRGTPRGLLEFNSSEKEEKIEDRREEEEQEEEEEMHMMIEEEDEDDEIEEEELLLIERKYSQYEKMYEIEDLEQEEEGQPEDVSDLIRLIDKEATRAKQGGRRKLAAAWLWLEETLLQEMGEDEEVVSLPKRNLLEKIDTFAESLKWVNALYDAELGHRSRNVPAHMPHFMDKTILERLHARWPKLFNQTAHHRFRHPRDMQFALSYYYYLIQVTKTYEPMSAFAAIDRDSDDLIASRADLQALRLALGLDLPEMKKEADSSTTSWSTRSWNSPPTNAPERKEDGDERVFASLLLNVSLFNLTRNVTLPVDFNLSLPVFLGLGALQARLMREEQKRPLFKHQMEDSDQVEFFMVGSDVTKVKRRLAELRTKQPKFICLNDDMGPDADGQLALALKEFYTSYLPKPSPLELPPGQVHNHASIAAYRSSRQQRNMVMRKLDGMEAPLLSLLCFLVVCVLLACVFKPRLGRSHAQ